MSLTPFTSQLIADVGISMGDEGKGRAIPEIVRELQQSTGQQAPVAIVLKVNGGANSGHTAGGVKLNLLPAGVVEDSVPVLATGSGVVADPRKFWWEIRPLEARGISVFDRLLIDERTMVSDLSHRLLDLAWEDYRVNVLHEESRGSTGRGITPAYLDEVGQFRIDYAVFRGDRDTFARLVRQRADRAVKTIRHVCEVSETAWHGFFDTLTAAEKRANRDAIEAGLFPESEFDFIRFKGSEPFTLNIDELIEVYWQAGSALRERIGDVREAVLGSLREGRRVIGEFGQAYWLDKRHGFSPNVTASHTYTPEIFQSAGIPAQAVHTFGVGKAYDTKVGTHIFVTQMPDDHPLAAILKQIEFGTSTGRQRMVGWFDAVEKGDTLRYGGFLDLMINKIDPLTHQGEWRGNLLICRAYEGPDGTIYHHVPRDQALHRRLKPIYVECPGWTEDLSSIRSFGDLPENARRYVAMMMRYTLEAAFHGEPLPDTLPNLRYLGVGPLPSQIIKDIPATRELIAMA
ncbi:MAG: adenylosuccinate synthase [Verrucomicrobia bacterium]|nr:MAG: adenylosuccinate synthase [Verrucomicrobiota bacterium]